MRRNIYNFLKEWKNRENSKPLLVLGARQIGKTTIIKKFGENEYKSYIYINFEEKPNMKSLFEENLSPSRIISDLELILEREIDSKNDLIIFDEVQIAPRCITSLKYFAENNIKYNICCAGSLLSVMLNNSNLSFPVGKVEFKYMYSFSFDEFLLALNMDDVITKIKDCYNNDKKMPIAVHEKLLNLYKDFLCIGSMPEAIIEYINKDKKLVNFNKNVHRNILNAYIADMGKYAKNNDVIKIQSIYKSIPEQLSKENKKFKYSTVKKGAKASHFESAIEWLIVSNINIIAKAINTPKLPISAYIIENHFKLFMNDIGILNSLANIPFSLIKDDDNHIYKGAIVENYVASELKMKDYDLYYYKDNSMEIDFIIQNENNIIPIEVKSKKNSRSRSFNKYINLYKPNIAYKISQGNFGIKDNIKSIPLYSVFLI